MKFPAFLISFAFLFSAHAGNVTFKLNMAGFAGFETPEVNGTFNGWCGNCNAMSDPDGDNIWEVTVDIPDGPIQYKFSFDNWAGEEELSYETQCIATDGTFHNRTLNVSGDMVLDMVCWGLCSDCLVPDDDIWVLNWSEEFEGNALDTDTWSHEFGSHGWGNNELQMYTSSPNNLEVSNGTLKITAREENVGGADYTSARIRTLGKMEFLYGKIEARIKVPLGQGIWPAFWMMGANFEEVGWPHCGEMDVMEHVNNEPLTNSAIHWFNGFGHTYETKTAPLEAEEWNVYGADWDEEGVTYLINDQPYFHFPFSLNDNTQPIFTQPFFLLLNVAVGGNWPGSPDFTTAFPAVMEVDYIRIFEKSGLSAGTDDRPEIRLFPVPTTAVLNVEFGESIAERSIAIFDVNGRQVRSAKAPGSQVSLHVSNLSPGTYFLGVLTAGGEERRFKFMKQ